MMTTNSKQKTENFSEESLTVDIISNLPDSMLSQILCCLPTTKEVVATSILSKRWRYVWTTVDKLVFESSGVNDMHFEQSVYKVLKFHQGNIKDLNLYCYKGGCNEFDITSWIDTAIARGVERLDVTTDFKWPRSIFSCDTLVDLKIWGYDRSMNIPTTAPIFPYLKKLHVQYMYFDVEFFNRIVTRCSALEHLIVDLRQTPVDIVSSSMKRLELHFTHPLRFDKKILLAAPSLEYLQMDCTLPTEFVVKEQLTSLIVADIYFREIRCTRNVNIKELRDSFVRFLQPLSNVKVLRLDCYCQRFLKFTGHGEFLNLTKLEIVSPFFEWRLFVSLMEASINLEAITLKKTSTAKKHKLVWIEPKKVPTCLSSSLKKISIDGFSEDELPMVKYVLRSAQILEQMDIHCANCYRDNKWKSDMLRKIRKLHRASARCEISLVKKVVGCCIEAKWECTTTYRF